MYVIDGLEEGKDFRYPNDPIEEEIIPKMERALGGEKVLPESFLHTEWGDIFMAYMPFYDHNGEVIGVVGIEFDASDSYQTYKELQKVTGLMGIVLVISGVIVSIWLFRRITNPLYLDKHTEDSPTGMKNRNAFEVDKHNLIVSKKLDNVGIIVCDINGLKEVNDRLGHIAGDSYIQLVADTIRETKTSTMVGYRTGGDEFVIFVQEATEEILDNFCKECNQKVKKQKIYDNMRCSVACGYSIFEAKRDQDFEDAFNRADEAMYKEKNRQKMENER